MLPMLMTNQQIMQSNPSILIFKLLMTSDTTTGLLRNMTSTQMSLITCMILHKILSSSHLPSLQLLCRCTTKPNMISGQSKSMISIQMLPTTKPMLLKGSLSNQESFQLLLQEFLLKRMSELSMTLGLFKSMTSILTLLTTKPMLHKVLLLSQQFFHPSPSKGKDMTSGLYKSTISTLMLRITKPMLLKILSLSQELFQSQPQEFLLKLDSELFQMFHTLMPEATSEPTEEMPSLAWPTMKASEPAQLLVEALSTSGDTTDKFQDMESEIIYKYLR